MRLRSSDPASRPSGATLGPPGPVMFGGPAGGSGRGAKEPEMDERPQRWDLETDGRVVTL